MVCDSTWRWENSLPVYIWRNTVFLFGIVAYSFLTDCILKELDFFRFYEYSESRQNRLCPLPYVSRPICHFLLDGSVCFCGFCLFDKAFPLLTVGGKGHTDSFGSLFKSSQSSEWVFGDITDTPVFLSDCHLESPTCFGLWSLKSWAFRTFLGSWLSKEIHDGCCHWVIREFGKRQKLEALSICILIDMTISLKP